MVTTHGIRNSELARTTSNPFDVVQKFSTLASSATAAVKGLFTVATNDAALPQLAVRESTANKLQSLFTLTHDKTPLLTDWYGPSVQFRDWADNNLNGCKLSGQYAEGTVGGLARSALADFVRDIHLTQDQKKAISAALSCSTSERTQSKLPSLLGSEERRSLYDALDDFSKKYPYVAPSATFRARITINPKTDLFSLTSTVCLNFPTNVDLSRVNLTQKRSETDRRPIEFVKVLEEPLAIGAVHAWVADCCDLKSST